jgi:hypothetical protein
MLNEQQVIDFLIHQIEEVEEAIQHDDFSKLDLVYCDYTGVIFSPAYFLKD